MTGSGGSGGSSRPGIDAGVRPDRGPTNIPMHFNSIVPFHEDGTFSAHDVLKVGTPCLMYSVYKEKLFSVILC